MRKGQTATLIFETNVDMAPYDTIILTISDYHIVKELRKKVNKGFATKEGSTISFDLEQADTLDLRSGEIMMQVRAANRDGSTAITSNIIRVPLEPALNEEVI